LEDAYTVRPIGVVRSPVTTRVDDVWGGVESTIELDERFGAEALEGLSDFSHAIVVYLFHEIEEDAVEMGSRRPRNNPNWPIVGIFAQRGSRRPNRIGVTVVEIARVHERTLTVHRLDAIDGTPVLDIKPYLREFDASGAIHQPEWSSEVMSAYWSLMSR
jgi:tRNA (adenine37-N6)-methyltransferase